MCWGLAIYAHPGGMFSQAVSTREQNCSRASGQALQAEDAVARKLRPAQSGHDRQYTQTTQGHDSGTVKWIGKCSLIRRVEPTRDEIASLEQTTHPPCHDE